MSRNPRKKRPAVAQKGGEIGYILSPRLDFWMTGGVSILVMLGLLGYIAMRGGEAGAGGAAVLGSAFVLHALLNWPHFMGAYSLLYRPAGNIRKYPMATLYVPLSLLAIIVWAVDVPAQRLGQAIAVNQEVGYFLWLVAAFYLAWHYTGQAWGMVATFARLSGTELTPAERWLVRSGFITLLVWHVVWGAQDLPVHWLGGILQYVPEGLQVMNVICCLAFLLGLAVWYRVAQRMARFPDMRILASWFSIYLWYLVLFFMPEAYLLVQFSHALQYLAFPLRVELNRAAGTAVGSRRPGELSWSLVYYVILVAAGLVVFYLPETVSLATQQFSLAVLIASAVSIHHYFVDSCIWKISNPTVRKELFAHLGKVK